MELVAQYESSDEDVAGPAAAAASAAPKGKSHGSLHMSHPTTRTLGCHPALPAQLFGG